MPADISSFRPLTFGKRRYRLQIYSVFSMLLPRPGKVKALERLGFATSPRVMRRLNARRILEYAWAMDAFTASDVMATTGLSRSTVIGVCDELVGTGWLQELGDARVVGDYRKGRPARRYALREDAAVVIGLDAGYDRMAATVADLRGRAIGGAEVSLTSTSSAQSFIAGADERLLAARQVVDRALACALVAPGSVRAVTVGVPAPVSVHGSPPGNDSEFWRLMNPGYGALFAGAAPIVSVENDANLAAIAERAAAAADQGQGQGQGQGQADSYIALLVGEGIGAGLMIDGRLVRGRHGGAGEMRFLDHVAGVGSADGLALCARRWAAEVIRSGALPRHSALGRLDAATLTEGDVALAAASGDPAAAAIQERLACRLARICLVLGGLLDVDRIIVGGSVVHTMPGVIRRAHEILADSGDPTCPALLASTIGETAVRSGAIQHALALVRETVFDLKPVPRA
jgi:predicted NBD/HSP70 family sugar kinase